MTMSHFEVNRRKSDDMCGFTVSFLVCTTLDLISRHRPSTIHSLEGCPSPMLPLAQTVVALSPILKPQSMRKGKGAQAKRVTINQVVIWQNGERELSKQNQMQTSPLTMTDRLSLYLSPSLMASESHANHPKKSNPSFRPPSSIPHREWSNLASPLLRSAPARPMLFLPNKKSPRGDPWPIPSQLLRGQRTASSKPFPYSTHMRRRGF